MDIQILSLLIENFSWIFDGIGTEIICSIISLVIGGLGGSVLGYKVGVKNRVTQKQKAVDNAVQQQIGSVNINNAK